MVHYFVLTCVDETFGNLALQHGTEIPRRCHFEKKRQVGQRPSAELRVGQADI